MSRRLSELRVPELRFELERRNRDRHGVKALLQERLAQAITEEGHNPDEYLFEAISEKKTPVKKTSRSGSIQGDFDEMMDDVNMENLVVKDEIMEDDTSLEVDNDKIENSLEKPKVEPATEVKDTDAEKVDTGKISNVKKREAPDSIESVESKRPCKDDVKIESDTVKKGMDINGLEAEDSINLDIGEDEFLNEEGEAVGTEKKDESLAAQGVVDVSSSSQNHPTDENTSGAVKQENAEEDDSAQDEKQQDLSHSDLAGGEDAKNDSTISDTDKGKDDKDSKKISASGSVSSRNLWVSGLSGSTSAKDLKQLCSRYGKVIGAKVVTNARTPGSRCYGYVTMASAEDANNCIKYLHRTELHGRMILMEKAKSESTSTTGYSGSASTSARNGRNPSQLRTPHRSAGNREKSSEGTSADKRKDSQSKDSKAEDDSTEVAKVKDGEIKHEDKDRKKSGSVNDNSHERKDNSRSKGTSQDRRLKEERNRDRVRQERERHRRPPPPRDFLSFSKIRKEREAQRAREQIRRARSEERRRRAAEQSLRELERRQRAEKHRQRVEKDKLALEREKLRIEREKIEREKHELNRLERERQKLERERIELERLELKRAQMRLEEERAKRSNYLYSSSGGSSGLLSRSKQTLPPPPPYEHTSSRSGADAGGNSNSSRFNMPLPPHLDVAAPVYDMPPGSSSNKTADRGPPSRDRPRDRDRRDFKRDYPPPPRHTSSSHTGGSGNTMKYPSNGASYEPRQPLPPGTRPRDQRYTSMDTANSREGAGSGMRERTAGNSGHDRSGGTSNTSYRPGESSRRSPKPTSRDHRYSDSTVTMKDFSGEKWPNSGGVESGGRYGSTIASGGGQYGDTRYGPSSYQSTSFF